MGGIRDAKHPNQASLWESKCRSHFAEFFSSLLDAE